MATDVVVLYNLALDAIGVRNKISLPTEQSREAEACNLWYPNIRDQILASASWPEATKMARLAQLSTQDLETWVQGQPRPDLTNSFALPVDCLRPQYLTDYSSFAIQYVTEENRALMANGENPILVYTSRQTKISFWSPELQMAVVYGLAASICSSLTGKTSRTKLLTEQANRNILAARESAANSGNERFESIPDWIAARGYSGLAPQSRFFYPFGSMLSVSNVN